MKQLKRYKELKSPLLETIESLEQLRILWYGEEISVVISNRMVKNGINTKTDFYNLIKTFSKI